ncbi:NAD-dependent epimerase/dehydratase family protein [Chitinophaga sp. RCC_12]|uniref:NAD-dependent epimerase/dehydratase family protein n=1 Tax=Chitinophaga sp. RCC_12 TaxID=3239226 RepID=UPI0035238CD8
MKTDILLTGASGFLGKVIYEVLSSQHLITTVGRGPAVANGGHLTADFSKELITGLPDVDCVIHCAGKAHSVPKTEEEKESFFQVNYRGTVNLCQSLQQEGKVPRSFIFISTVAVYGKEEGVLISEDDPLDGTSPYAKSKIMAEEYLQEWAAVNNVKLGILRLPLIAGPTPPGNLQAMINGIRTGRYLSIGKADARKSMVWAYDVAMVIPAVAQRGGIYNLTDSRHPSFRELEYKIAEGLGRKAPLTIPLPLAKLLALAGDVMGDRFPINTDKLKKITATLTFDDARAKSSLNWRPSPVAEKIRFVV